MREFFVKTGRGLEELAAGELAAMGIGTATAAPGGVAFTGTMADCYRANLRLRTASRVLMPLAVFPCSSPQELYDGVRSIPWPRYITPDMTMAVDANLRDSSLTHSGFVALKSKDAIVDSVRDACGRRPDVQVRDPDLRVNVHLLKNRCTVSLDTSGDPLDRRGYRLDRNEAPLRETLAAALVLLSGWDGSVPLLDPMCGSGTIPIEAALLAAGRAPGLLRERFGFQRWPSFEPELWSAVRAEADGLSRDTLPAPVIGRDRDPAALAVASRNSARAGVERLVVFQQGEFQELVPPAGPGIILFNPPYGERLGEKGELVSLYRTIGDVLKQRCTGYTAYILCGDADLAKQVGLRATRRIVIWNGPIECRLLKYELY